MIAIADRRAPMRRDPPPLCLTERSFRDFERPKARARLRRAAIRGRRPRAVPQIEARGARMSIPRRAKSIARGSCVARPRSLLSAPVKPVSLEVSKWGGGARPDEKVELGECRRMAESELDRSGVDRRMRDRASWPRWLPGLDTLCRYQAAWLPHDLVAGLVLATMLVPVGIAYAV